MWCAWCVELSVVCGVRGVLNCQWYVVCVCVELSVVCGVRGVLNCQWYVVCVVC